jgi:hypothetical protein
MGSSYGRRLAQWSNARYPGADNTQDDVSGDRPVGPVIADDHAAAGRGLHLLPATPVTGLIGSRSDVDAFAFVASDTTQLSVTGPAGVSDLDIALTVLNAAGTAGRPGQPHGGRRQRHLARRDRGP